MNRAPQVEGLLHAADEPDRIVPHLQFLADEPPLCGRLESTAAAAAEDPAALPVRMANRISGGAPARSGAADARTRLASQRNRHAATR